MLQINLPHIIYNPNGIHDDLRITVILFPCDSRTVKYLNYQQVKGNFSGICCLNVEHLFVLLLFKNFKYFDDVVCLFACLSFRLSVCLSIFPSQSNEMKVNLLNAPLAESTYRMTI